MIKFKVHAYIDVRIPIDVEAESFEKKVILEEVDAKLLDKMAIINGLIQKTDAEVTDDINEYVVDRYDEKGMMIESRRFLADWSEIK